MTVGEFIEKVIRANDIRGNAVKCNKALKLVLWMNRDVLKRLKDR